MPRSMWLCLCLARAYAEQQDAACMLQQQSQQMAFLQHDKTSVADLPNEANCKKKFTSDQVCRTTSNKDCTYEELTKMPNKCWFPETSGVNPCKPYPVSGTWATAKIDFPPDEAGTCFSVPRNICPVQICVKSGSGPNSGGPACYSGKLTCGTNGGPSNGFVDQTACVKWTAPSKFCIVSLNTNKNNPNNIQDLSNFAVQFGCCDGNGGVVGDPHIHTLDGNQFDLYDKGTYSVFHYDDKKADKKSDVDWQLFATYGGALWTVQGLLLVDRSLGRFRQALELTSEDCQWRSKTGDAAKWSAIEGQASVSLLEDGKYVTGFEYINEKHINLRQGEKDVLVINTVCKSGAINLRVAPQKAFDPKFLTGQIQAGNAEAQERFPVEESWESLGGSDGAASFFKTTQEEKHLLVTSCTEQAKKQAEETCVKHLGEESRENEESIFTDCVFDVCRGGESFAIAAAELRSVL